MKQLLLSFAFAAAALAQQVAVDHIEWKRLDRDRVVLAVHLSASARDDAAIRALRFERMSIAGMPFFLSPPPGRIVFQAGSPAALDPVPVTIYLRDVQALASLRQMIDKESVAIRGEARFEVELPLLGRILLWSSTANAAVPLKAEVPFLIPGGSWGRAAALTAISAAEKVVTAYQYVWPQTEWERSLRANVLPALIPLQTTFTIDTANGRQTHSIAAIGFYTAQGRILTPSETVEPWRYDPAVAAAQGRLVSSETRGQGTTLRLANKDIEMEALFLSLGNGKEIRTELGKRNSNRNKATLDVAGSAIRPLTPVSDKSDAWDRLAVFRFAAGSEILFVAGRRVNGRIVFNDPIDPATLGSPVLSPLGLIGYVQDEYSAALIVE